MKPPPPDTVSVLAAPGVTVTAADVPAMVARTLSRAVRVSAPAVRSVAVKVCDPASAAVNVYDSGWVTAWAAPLTATVPVNPGTGLPLASTAVTVTGTGAPAWTIAGADTCRPTAPAMLVPASLALTSTITLPT